MMLAIHSNSPERHGKEKGRTIQSQAQQPLAIQVQCLTIILRAQRGEAKEQHQEFHRGLLQLIPKYTIEHMERQRKQEKDPISSAATIADGSGNGR